MRLPRRFGPQGVRLHSLRAVLAFYGQGTDAGASFRHPQTHSPQRHCRHTAAKGTVEWKNVNWSSSARVRDGEKIITLKDGSEIAAGAVIVASGASFRKQGCPGESTYTGMGVSYCAVCDAAFFEELEVAVIGGGNTAVEEACYLTGFASKVYLVHRRDQFRADKMVVDHALNNPKIVPVMDSVLESIEGSDIVEKIVVRNVKTNEKREIPLSGVFIFIGTLPNDEYVHDLLQKDEGGWIVTDASLQTSVPGIFAAGDVRDTSLRQVVTAAGDGARAAMSAYAYLQR